MLNSTCYVAQGYAVLVFPHALPLNSLVCDLSCFFMVIVQYGLAIVQAAGLAAVGGP